MGEGKGQQEARWDDRDVLARIRSHLRFVIFTKPMQKAQKFVAKLVGEADGKSVSQEFENAVEAIAWAEEEGLAGFESQSVNAEVRTSAGEVYWQKSDLKTPPVIRLARDDP